MQFKNRRSAGQHLAKDLAVYADRADVLVLALPRGGVPVAFEVAKALNVPLDVFVVRKLGVPGREELAMGAIASGGVQVLNDDIVRSIPDFNQVITLVAAKETKELERRETLYRGDRPFPTIQGRIVILVDDGLATGATMRAAVEALRNYQPASIVIAVPVSAPETYQQLQAKVEEIVCAVIPKRFYSVGLWYEDFPQTTDEEVRNLLTTAANGSQSAVGGEKT
ncbi:phosphoribosyltransferase [Iningainema tapete]|uniref:Phosphoribosyltransferase n=1 Tax=Iningainema tapete BLCC-T55 TaxID=2748662 RepID=A0A8J6XQ33_9CYAN|nr:phosphoribosyltransferase [Iningainema tapete]MBD2776140.1 phosphoribosyltransferase [Iningainema tapete BLCC-T55]